MLIDAHVHLPVVDEYISLQQKKNKLLQEMRRNQVDQCIVISDSSIESTIGFMDECVKLFKKTDNVYVIGGISPFFDFQKQLKKLKKYLEEKAIIGIKLFTGHETFYLTDERLSEVYNLAIRYNVPVLFHSGWDNSQYGDVSLAIEIAKKYPELKLVCCHCFYPNIKKCQSLIEYSNVYFDLSSIADDVTILREVKKEVKTLIEIVPTRVIFGSDYSCCSQKKHIELIKGLELDKEVEDRVFYENAKQIYFIAY